MSEATVSTYVTITGLPLTIELAWPFHHSTSGADFEVLHGILCVADGSGLHADVSVHVSQTVREALPSLEPRDAHAVVINALRKEVDVKQLEFLKSGKRQPVPLSTRFMHFRTRRWQFSSAPETAIALMLRDRVYWAAHKMGAGHVKVIDACEAMYVGSTIETIAEVARGLARQELIALDGEHALATDSLIALGAEIERRKENALASLQQKHEYEQSKT
ncbi:MAG TPA: hypothetical protein VN622_11710 [Clostridia bacterium]|nr:hypothetical protein [Clostridia bacterium]